MPVLPGKIKAIKYWKRNLSDTIKGIETLKIAIKSNKMNTNDKKGCAKTERATIESRHKGRNGDVRIAGTFGGNGPN